MQRFVLVTGAGASRNLNTPGSAPIVLMDGWAAVLRDRLGPDFSHMLGLDQVATGQDFEELLGELTRWIQLKDLNVRFASMTSRTSAGDDRIAHSFRQGLRNAEKRGLALEATLDATLFEQFGPSRVDPDVARKAYDRLLKELDPGHPKEFICATTNYDRSLEIALRGLKYRARTGFYHDGIVPPAQLSPDGLGTYQDQPSILHLHGAVGWYRDPKGEVIEYPAADPYRPEIGQPAVLYPSNNKVVEDSIVHAIWVEFDKALEAASHVLVLGHGLADDHLVTRLRALSVPLAVTALTDADAKKFELLLPNAAVIEMDFPATLMGTCVSISS